MIKKIIDAYLIARRFELNLKSLKKVTFPKQKTYKVRLTKGQMNLLYANIALGIHDIDALQKATGLKIPKL